MLMRKREPYVFDEDQYMDLEKISFQDLPDSMNWTAKGAVTPVKNQGTVGSCYAFSTTGNIEGQHFLNGNTLVGLSEEQIVDCDYLDCGVFGGWPYQAMDYIIKTGGVETESSYPYCAGNGDCYPCMANKNQTFCGPPPSYCNRTCLFNSSNPNVQINSWKAIQNSSDDILSAVNTVGPLSVLLNAEWLQFYHSGVLNPYFCDPTSLDHAVLITGYGIDDGILKKTPYWLVKNSWGKDWADYGGYFKIIRDEYPGKCGINTNVVTSVINKK